MYTCYIAWILYSLTSSISRNGIAKSKCMCICNLISISKLSSLEFALITLSQAMYKNACFLLPSTNTMFYQFFYFLKLIFIEIYLTYNVVLISAIQQSESVICIHLSTSVPCHKQCTRVSAFSYLH